MNVDRKQYPHQMKTKTTSSEEEAVYYSDLMVLQSGAGYYIGREGFCVDDYGGFAEPYSRESEYYPTREAAQKALESGMFDRESGVENMHARSIGNLPPKE